MPRIASQRKALRTATRRRTRNLTTLKTLRAALKKTSAKTINTTYKLVDKAAKLGVVSPSRAARLKSRAIKAVKSTPKREDKPKATVKKTKTTAKTAKKPVRKAKR